MTEGKITVNVRSKSRGNQFWFELARGLSYRESTVCYFITRTICWSNEKFTDSKQRISLTDLFDVVATSSSIT